MPQTNEDIAAAAVFAHHLHSGLSPKWSVVDLAHAFMSHREAERERCAMIAEGWQDPAFATEHENRCFEGIASTIRGGSRG
jgi:hypothetical protein